MLKARSFPLLVLLLLVWKKKSLCATAPTGGVAVAAGTMGLHASLITLDVKRDDLVIVPSFTFIASANAIAHAGALPWLIDVDAESWSLSPQALSAALKKGTMRRDGELVHKATGRRVAAIMPVYTLGTVADMDALNVIAAEYQLPVVADAAAAIGVTYKGRDIAELADLTVFSFNGNKTITSGGGGMIIGRDESLLKRAKHITTTARVSPDYEHDQIGYNYRMTNLEAAVGCAQMQRLDQFIETKRRIRRNYDDAFADISGIARFPQPQWSESTCWFSGFSLVGEGMPSVAEICSQLSNKGIEARPFWRPVHLQKPYANAPAEDMGVTQDVWNKIVTLPCSTSLSDDDQAYVIDCVRQVLPH